MGFSFLLIFAVLQISFLCAGVNSSSEDLSNDFSNHRHARSLPRFALGHQIKAKKKFQGILDSSTYLELVNDKKTVSIEDEDYYICIRGTCDTVETEVVKTGDQCKGANPAYLVNKDNFEILEWNTWGDVHNGQTPVKPVTICNSLYITKKKQTVGSFIKRLFRKTNVATEILTLSTDIKSQHLQIDNYNITQQKLFNTSKVIKHFKAENRNCKPAKHVLLLDQSSDRSRSFQKGLTVTTGHGWEFSIGGKIPTIEIDFGKYTVKYEESHLTSETISELDKVQHSVNMEIEVPANQFCSVKITSKSIMVQVPFSGQLIREYGHANEIRMTNITDMYYHWEEAELQSSVDPCKPLPDGTKC